MFSNIGDILMIVVGFGVLIFVHELGHFAAAKWAGIRAEGFAIGMGPVVVAWRKGIGVRFGSTVPEYQRRAQKELAEQRAEPKGRNEKSEAVYTERQMYEAADKLELGETEYSLRWLPIGGFVKMLGQEDLHPNRQSDDARSYNSCSIGKRMIVVSAGVIMNVIFAAILFIIAFSVGVQFEAPVVGAVSNTMPAANAVAINAEQLGVQNAGFEPGDQVITIDGKEIHTFADIQIATAMARGDRPLLFHVKRDGVAEPLQFRITPTKDAQTGLLGIGMAPASDTTLAEDILEPEVKPFFESTVLAKAGVMPGMTMTTAAGQSLDTFQRYERIVEESNGRSVATTWVNRDARGEPIGSPIAVDIPVEAELQVLIAPAQDPKSMQNFELGLFGFVPLTKIKHVDAASSNAGVLHAGDVVLRIGDVHGPTMGVFRKYIESHPQETIQLLVLRDGKEVEVDASVSSKGRLDVIPTYALDTLFVAESMKRVKATSATVAEKGEGSTEPSADTPIAALELLPRTRITRVGDVDVSNWREMREAMKVQTAGQFAAGGGAELTISYIHPTEGGESETQSIALAADDVKKLHELGWASTVPGNLFDSLYVTRSAGGNPLTAISMGVDETQNAMVLTYLTIDRLIRGTVGVEQLRGPVGIVHIGSKIADRGFMYIIFFLAMISVNLAVINFLPLPIVDGGLFLFLIYEKFKGRPPSPAFQHWATVAGLFLIGTAFLVVTWNDVMRLIS